MISVFYDDKCGLCTREINYYKKICPKEAFDWKGVSTSKQALEDDGISISYALRILHAKDQNGDMHLGVDAFILIWRQIKGWKYLAVFVSLPIIYGIAGFFYKRFSNWRFNKLEHCQLALNMDSK